MKGDGGGGGFIHFSRVVKFTADECNVQLTLA